jgi:hypothetical protein
MDLQSVQRNYDNQSEPDAGETVFDDMQRCMDNLDADVVLDAVAQYLCNNRDGFSVKVLLTSLCNAGDKAQAKWVKRNEAADADAREGV